MGVVMLFGLLGGLCLLPLAGARRTRSAYPRFLEEAHASTMAVDPGQYDPGVDRLIAGFPEVRRSTTYVAFQTGRLVAGRPDFAQDFETIGTLDGRFFTMDRFTPTSGRMPDVGRADEVVMNVTSAERYHYRVGQRLELGTYSEAQTSEETFFSDPPPPVIRTSATIVGIGLFVDEVIQDDTNATPLMLVTPAFSKAAAEFAGYAWQGLELRHGDADIAAVKARYMARQDPGTPQFFRVTSVDTFHVQQAVQPLSLALAVFGAIAGVAAVVLVGQELARQRRTARSEHELLRALGSTPRMTASASLAAPVAAVGAGAGLAVVLAILGSPLMPLGGVRRVEVDRGFDADWVLLGGVTTGLFALVVLVEVAAAVRERPARPRGSRLRPHSWLASSATRAALPPSITTGLRFAFEPQDGSSAMPIRSVIYASVVAVTTLIAALTFGASFQHLLASPALYGWDWDAAVLDQSGYGNIDADLSHAVLDPRSDIAGWSGAFFGADSIDSYNLPLLGMDPGSDVAPPLLSGRMLRADDEIVLGSSTARTLHKQPGDDVQIGVGKRLSTLRVVGTATLPAIGALHGAHTSMGVGALVVPARIPGFDRFASGDGPPGSRPAAPAPTVLFVRFTPGADRTAATAALTRASRGIGQYPGSAVVLGPQRPAEIVNSTEAGAVPTLLAGALGLGTAVSLSVALSGSVRRRRRDLALLRSLGFKDRQMAATVACQATATITVGLLAGIPLGIAAGHVMWSAFARRLDVVTVVTVPVVVVMIVAVVALLFANLAAALPARFARRVRPAEVLRAD